MIAFPLGTPGGKRIRILRMAKEWTQDQLSEATRISRNHISNIETGRKSGQGTEPRPSEEMLDAILTALDAKFGERRSVYESYGYQIPIPLPNENEIAWAYEVFHKELEGLKAPAYLLDCALRLHTWNVPLLHVLGGGPQLLDRFKGRYLSQAIYEPPERLIDQIANRAEMESQLARTLRFVVAPYLEQEWVVDMLNVSNIQIESLDTPTEIPARPTGEIHFRFTDPPILKFIVVHEPFIRDDRFRVTYYYPVDDATRALLQM